MKTLTVKYRITFPNGIQVEAFLYSRHPVNKPEKTPHTKIWEIFTRRPWTCANGMSFILGPGFIVEELGEQE